MDDDLNWLAGLLLAALMNVLFYKVHPSFVDFSPKRLLEKCFIYFFGRKVVLFRSVLIHILLHLLILRTVQISREDVFVVLIMENALDTRVQTPHRGREQSSHHASILMDIFNVTSLMTAPECPMGGWFVVRMVATFQPM